LPGLAMGQNNVDSQFSFIPWWTWFNLLKNSYKISRIWPIYGLKIWQNFMAIKVIWQQFIILLIKKRIIKIARKKCEIEWKEKNIVPPNVFSNSIVPDFWQQSTLGLLNWNMREGASRSDARPKNGIEKEREEQNVEKIYWQPAGWSLIASWSMPFGPHSHIAKINGKLEEFLYVKRRDGIDGKPGKWRGQMEKANKQNRNWPSLIYWIFFYTKFSRHKFGCLHISRIINNIFLKRRRNIQRIWNLKV
jgi:hypothetical protein